MFTAEKCKRDWPIGGKAASATACVCVRIRGQNLFELGNIRVKGCLNQEVPLYVQKIHTSPYSLSGLPGSVPVVW